MALTNLLHPPTSAYFPQDTALYIRGAHLLPKHLRRIQSMVQFSILFPYILCCNVLCDFVSLKNHQITIEIYGADIMKGFERGNQLFPLCVLNCGLCPMLLENH